MRDAGMRDSRARVDDGRCDLLLAMPSGPDRGRCGTAAGAQQGTGRRRRRVRRRDSSDDATRAVGQTDEGGQLVAVEVIKLAMQGSMSQGPARAVLLVLAYHGRRDGSRAHPTVETIAWEAGLHRSTVFDALKQLQAIDEITPAGTVGRGIKVWQINVPRLEWVAGGDESPTTTRRPQRQVDDPSPTATQKREEQQGTVQDVPTGRFDSSPAPHLPDVDCGPRATPARTHGAPAPIDFVAALARRRAS